MTEKTTEELCEESARLREESKIVRERADQIMAESDIAIAYALRNLKND